MRSRYRFILLIFLLLSVIIIFLLFHKKEIKFEIVPKNLDQNPYMDNVGHCYINRDGIKTKVIVTQNGNYVSIGSVKINKNGVVAFAVYFWEGTPFSVSDFGKPMSKRKSKILGKYYLLLVNKGNIIPKEFPKEIVGIEWVAEDKIKVIMLGENPRYIKNPFYNANK